MKSLQVVVCTYYCVFHDVFSNSFHEHVQASMDVHYVIIIYV